MNKPIDLLINTTVWLGEYYNSPLKVLGMRFNRITIKEYNYNTRAFNILGKDILGYNRSFEFYYN